MRTVSIDGVVYTKVKDMADKYGYTTDYIGQLCRGDKLNCQLVGRAWYVSEDSILVHRKGSYKSSRQSEKTSNNNVEVKHSASESHPVQVRPMLRKTAVRNFNHQGVPTAQHKRFSSPVYHSDEIDLLPKPAKSQKEPELEPYRHTVHINKPHKEPVYEEERLVEEVEESASLKIKSESKPRKMSFTNLPTVPLKGTLKVRPVAHPEMRSFEDSASTPVQKDVSVASYAPKKVVRSQPLQSEETPVSVAEELSVASAPTSSKSTVFIVLVMVLASLLFAGFSVFGFWRIESTGTDVQNSFLLSPTIR